MASLNDNQSNEPKKDDKTLQNYAALGVGFVCIIIGLPLWWKTTEVYRVQLPYQEIFNIANGQTRHIVDFTVVVYDINQRDTDLASFGEKLKAKFDEIEGVKTEGALRTEYRGNIRQPQEEELNIVQKQDDVLALDAQLNRFYAPDDFGQIHFILIPNDSKLKLTKPWIGRGRNIFMPIGSNLNDVIPDVVKLLREEIISESTLHKAFYRARGLVMSKSDKESMRAVRSHSGYDVTFTLLNSEPQMLAVDWKIQEAIEEYMTPMLNSFSDFVHINVKSQYLHYVDLGVTPREDKEQEGFRLDPEQLPHIINPIETYLSSHVSTNPNINFVLYIAPRKQNPLRIYDNQGKPHASNSFMSPSWGGILIHNVEYPENASQPYDVSLDMKPVMEVFLSQLRLLLGVNQHLSGREVDIQQPGRSIVAGWELDQWLRLRALENIATSVSTLHSLAQLLEKISNIVINNDIGREVQLAVTSVHEAQIYLFQSKLKEAFFYSRRAMLSAEKAFFDPSLLELLYFPEDQKFAIYIPLFLPISIPVVLSLMQAFKLMRGKNKPKTD